MYRSLLGTAALLSLAVAAHAADAGGPPNRGGPQRGPQQSAEERFKTMDSNKDGKLSLAEYTAAGPMAGRPGGGQGGAAGPGQGAAGGQGQRPGGGQGMDRTARFKTIDTDQDNFLSLAEYQASRNQRGGPAGPGGRRGNRQGGNGTGT